MGLHKLADAVGHSAHHLVLAVIVHRSLMESGGHGGVVGKTVLDPLHQISLSAGQQKFLHIHRVEGFHVHLPHRERELPAVDCYPQQTAAGNHMVLRGLFAEVFQGGQRPFAQLHLIKNYQRLFPNDRLPGDAGQQGDKIAGLNTFIKSLDQAGICLEIEIGHIFIVLLSKFQQNVGFAHLPCALQNQGLAIGAVLPVQKILCHPALHVLPSCVNYIISIADFDVKIKSNFTLKSKQNGGKPYSTVFLHAAQNT